MRIVDFDYTLTASPVPLSDPTFTAFVGIDKFAHMRIVPKSSNTHVVNVPGPNGVPLKQIAKPTATDVVQDQFDLAVSGTHNELKPEQIALSGTLNEQAFVSLYIE